MNESMEEQRMEEQMNEQTIVIMDLLGLIRVYVSGEW